MQPVDYGERLAYALTISGVTRGELAEALGVSESAIGQVINGQTRAMNAANCAEAAKVLRVNTYWLATGKGAPELQERPPPLDPMALELAYSFMQIPPEREKARDQVYSLCRYYAQGGPLLGDTPQSGSGPNAKQG